MVVWETKWSTVVLVDFEMCILIRINTLLVFLLSQLRSLAAVVHPLPCVVTN